MAENELNEATIANWSLVELGQRPSFSIDSETTLGGVYDIMWPRAVAHCFSLHDWTFCRQTFRLTRQDETPATGYQYGFDLPGGRLGEPLRTMCDPRSQSPLRNKRIEGNTLFADEPDVYAVCKMRVRPAYWDWHFANCFATAFAGYLAVPLLQDADMAAEKLAQAFGTRSEGGAGGMFGRLIAQYRAAEPVGSPLMANDPLTAAYGGLPWYGRF